MRVKEWLSESPRKEELALLQDSKNTHAIARHDGAEERSRWGWRDAWSELTKNEDFNPWMMAKLKGLLPRSEAGV